MARARAGRSKASGSYRRGKQATMSKKITLQYPIEFDGETIKSITVNRPKGGDAIEAQKHAEDDPFKLYSRLTGLPSAVFSEMDLTDLAEVTEAVEGFLPERARKMLGLQ